MRRSLRVDDVHSANKVRRSSVNTKIRNAFSPCAEILRVRHVVRHPLVATAGRVELAGLQWVILDGWGLFGACRLDVLPDSAQSRVSLQHRIWRRISPGSCGGESAFGRVDGFVHRAWFGRDSRDVSAMDYSSPKPGVARLGHCGWRIRDPAPIRQCFGFLNPVV